MFLHNYDDIVFTWIPIKITFYKVVNDIFTSFKRFFFSGFCLVTQHSYTGQSGCGSYSL